MTTINIDGMNKDDAMTSLIGEHGLTFKEATEYWKDNGGSKRTGFRAMFYRDLLNADMDKDEVKEYCEKHGSANDMKAYSHYYAIAKLISEVRSRTEEGVN